MELEIIISLLTLTFMEIVLGIDNLVFISIVSSKLPEDQQKKARRIGLALALIMRILLLLSIAWITRLTGTLFTLAAFGESFDVSGRDVILIAGGLFLLAKSTTEIHGKLEGEHESEKNVKVKTLGRVIIQIILLDLVFSFDSILTAVGLVKEIWVMVVAVIIAMIIMLIFVNKISSFIDKHPTVKMLALSFLLLIGFMLILEGLHMHVPKGYIYFAIFFSLFVEMLNLRLRKKSKPVKLHEPDYEKGAEQK